MNKDDLEKCIPTKKIVDRPIKGKDGETEQVTMEIMPTDEYTQEPMTEQKQEAIIADCCSKAEALVAKIKL